MRLLNALAVKHDQFEFRDFLGVRSPLYAILSHTWDEEEVIYQDLLTDTAIERARKKAGYAKLKDFAALAEAENFVWIWMDTCCIDKASSAELTEAINSMYDWYAKAAACYAYLADVEYTLSGPGSDAQETLTAKVLAVPRDRLANDHRELIPRDHILYSRWFHRGWTLQELIAPSEVVFFDKNWKRIGPKTKIYDALSVVTGIPGSVLGGFRPTNTFSVAQKMSWASCRITTRLEDEAYCLLGLFDINMPLLYGEGPKAFLRLQLEIVSLCDDQSIFAWGDTSQPISWAWEQNFPNTLPSFSGLLAPGPRYFGNMREVLRIEPFTSENLATITSGRIRFPLPIASLCHRGPIDSKREDGFVGILACVRGAQLLGIQLRRTRVGQSDYFVRTDRKMFYIPLHMVETTSAQTMLSRVTDLPLHAPLNARFRIIPEMGRGYSPRAEDMGWYEKVDLSRLIPAEFAGASRTYTLTESDFCFQLGAWDKRVRIVATWPSDIDVECRIWAGDRGTAAVALAPGGKRTFLLLLHRRRGHSACEFVECDDHTSEVCGPLLEKKMAHILDRDRDPLNLPKLTNSNHEIAVGPDMRLEARVHPELLIPFAQSGYGHSEVTVDLFFLVDNSSSVVSTC